MCAVDREEKGGEISDGGLIGGVADVNNLLG